MKAATHVLISQIVFFFVIFAYMQLVIMCILVKAGTEGATYILYIFFFVRRILYIYIYILIIYIFFQKV